MAYKSEVKQKFVPRLHEVADSPLYQPERAFEASELRTRFHDIFYNRLSVEEQAILKLRYLSNACGRSHEEIGKMFGIGRSAVQQMEAKTVRKFRDLFLQYFAN